MSEQAGERAAGPEQALRRLELIVVRRLDGLLHGGHLGLLPGPGSELGDSRVYVPGEDDVRRMDWAVTARTTVPHVRDLVADRGDLAPAAFAHYVREPDRLRSAVMLETLVKRYLAHVREALPDPGPLTGARIVVDCANCMHGAKVRYG